MCLEIREYIHSNVCLGCNRYCVDWAKALLKGDHNAAYQKQIIDSYKLKVQLHDMYILYT